MEIRNNTQNLNFNARLISKAVTHVGKNEISLYKLGAEDKGFLDNFVSRANLKKLYPTDSSYDGFLEWNAIIKTSALKAGRDNMIMATCDKRPCGFLIFKEKPHKKLHITKLVTWGVRKDVKPPHVGKILMHSVFSEAQKDQMKSIYFIPNPDISLGKSDYAFYEKINFKASDSITDERYIFDCANLGKSKAQLEYFFDIKNEREIKDVNLTKELSLTYHETLKEKIFSLLKGLANKANLTK